MPHNSSGASTSPQFLEPRIRPHGDRTNKFSKVIKLVEGYLFNGPPDPGHIGAEPHVAKMFCDPLRMIILLI